MHGGFEYGESLYMYTGSGRSKLEAVKCIAVEWWRVNQSEWAVLEVSSLYVGSCLLSATADHYTSKV